MPTRRRVLVGGAALAAAAPLAPAIACASKTRSARALTNVVDASPHVDGAGVKLAKLLGTRSLPMLDPFLMLDRFKSNDPRDYERGFPNHPHRGFETVSIVLDGHVVHGDSVGNRGDIAGGGVQWMTAGRGIVHSEMLRGADGTNALWGYQLWVNLPARLKMTKPRYQDVAAGSIATTSVGDARVRVLAGRVGPVDGAVRGVETAPTLLDAALERGARFVHAIPAAQTGFLVVAQGAIDVGGRPLADGQLGVLGAGDAIDVVATAPATRVLMFAGTPIGEPVARRGPFVMNTDAELRQAYDDYRSGRLVDG